MKKKLQYIAPQTEEIRVQVESLMGLVESPGGGLSGNPDQGGFEDGEDWASRDYDDWED